MATEQELDIARQRLQQIRNPESTGGDFDLARKRLAEIRGEEPRETVLDTEKVRKLLRSRSFFQRVLGLQTAIPRVTTELAIGAGKGVIETVRGAERLGERFLEQTGGRIAERITGRPKEEIVEPGIVTRAIPEEAVEAVTPAEKVGKFGERVAELAIPGTKVAKATKTAGLLTKIVSRALTSGGIVATQTGKVGKEAGFAAAIDAGIPIADAVLTPVFNVVKRLFRGLGSGLSGVSTDVIDTIVDNPQKAQEVVEEITEKGNFAILKRNADDIVEGVSKIRQEARMRFGEGLKVLKEIDINPQSFRKSIQTFLDDVGSSVKGVFRTLDKVDFNDPKSIQKASNLIDDVSKTKLDGLSLRNILNKVSKSRFKRAITEEARAFNAFIGDLEDAIRKAIGESTDKLSEINKIFSQDMQLAGAIEKIFGKVKFKNLEEINKVSQQLESLFGKKGLSPEIIDNFLNKIGISPTEFKVTEAVRQISGKVQSAANRAGVTFAELTQSITGAILSPQAIRKLSIITGLAEDIVKPLFERVAPTVRAGLIELIVGGQE
jgi:hypothetical protein